MIQCNYTNYTGVSPLPSHCNKLYSQNQIPTEYQADDDGKQELYGVSIGNAGALMPKPSFFKNLWKGIKKFFTKTPEKPQTPTLEELKDYGKNVYDLYDVYDQIQNNPNYNYQRPQLPHSGNTQVPPQTLSLI